jgi:hypothetical protein
VTRVSVEVWQEVVVLCRAIDAGNVAPREGAARIWVLMAEAGYPVETDEFRVFAGMLSEIQDYPEHEAAYEADIRVAASAVVARYPAA